MGHQQTSRAKRIFGGGRGSKLGIPCSSKGKEGGKRARYKEGRKGARSKEGTINSMGKERSEPAIPPRGIASFWGGRIHDPNQQTHSPQEKNLPEKNGFCVQRAKKTRTVVFCLSRKGGEPPRDPSGGLLPS